MSRGSSSVRPARRPSRSRPLAAGLERLEERLALDTSTGAVVTDLLQRVEGRTLRLVLTFSEPLDPALAGNTAQYQVTAPPVGGRAPSIPVVSAALDPAGTRLTLGLDRALRPQVFYQLAVNGQANGLKGADGTIIDGDNDQTPGGNYLALFARGQQLRYTDATGDRVTLALRGPGRFQLTRLPNGDATRLRVENATAPATRLLGRVNPSGRGDGTTSIPSLVGMEDVDNRLAFPPFRIPRAPVLANATNLPYSIRVEQVSMPDFVGLQSAVTAQAGGKWLLFGGRTNGLHGFDPPPDDDNFPRAFANRNIYVVDPATGQVWSRSWDAAGLSADAADALSSTNQQHYQTGETLYVTGGYGVVSATGAFTTFDTLTAIDVPGLIDAVVGNGAVAPEVRQIRDERVRVTGGEMAELEGRTYLVFGQNFQGRYTGGGATIVQIYTNQIRSFRIVDSGGTLSIADYTTQDDPVAYRRRDGNMQKTISPAYKPGLTFYGGVFTPDGQGYRNPVRIANRRGVVDLGFQQYFSQYSSPVIPLFSARDRSMHSLFLGGISLYDYDPATGQLNVDTNLPFVDDLTAQVRSADGLTQEYILTPQLPARLGAEAAFFVNPELAAFPNGVINLDALTGPTVLGHMAGGILATAGNNANPLTQTFASPNVYRITLVPNRAT